MYVLTNCVIYTNSSDINSAILHDHCVVIDDEIISAILPLAQCPIELEKVDLAGANLCAGFIDLQLNGCGGVLFNNDISVATLEIMQVTNERFGCTSFLPTLITTNDSDMHNAVAVMAQFQQQYSHQALGLHLEGPYLSLAKKGIHSSALLRNSEQSMIDFMCQNSAQISTVTIAPEQTQLKHIKQLSQAGIQVSLGHSNASYSEAMQCFSAGASFTTHLFNAMSSITGRDPGVVGATYDTKNNYAGIIVDGHHVDYANVRMSHKLLGERLVLVTDGVAPAGANIESFDFVGTEVFYRNGKCVGADGTLGGSALTMIEAVENTVKKVGLTLVESLRMASLYPAKSIGVDEQLGSISVGKVANITVLDDKFKVQKTIVNGQIKSFS